MCKNGASLDLETDAYLYFFLQGLREFLACSKASGEALRSIAIPEIVNQSRSFGEREHYTRDQLYTTAVIPDHYSTVIRDITWSSALIRRFSSWRALEQC